MIPSDNDAVCFVKVNFLTIPEESCGYSAYIVYCGVTAIAQVQKKIEYVCDFCK